MLCITGSRAEAEGLRVKDEIVWVNGDDSMTKSLEAIHDKIHEVRFTSRFSYE